MTKSSAFQTVPFPAARATIVDAGHLSARRHIAHGLLEVDVTVARQFMQEHKARTGESLSFTAYVIHCLAAVIKVHPLVQAYRGWRGNLVLFDDVDAATLIEIEQGGIAVPHIIRAANQKTFQAIHQEIRAVQARRSQSPQQIATGSWIFRLPRFVRLPVMRLAMKNPHFLQRHAGTVVVTSVGMFGRGHGWGLGFLAMHTLGIALGGIAQKPVLVDGALANHDFLCITISFDHDVVDGAPVARFARSFKDLLESGSALADLQDSSRRGE